MKPRKANKQKRRKKVGFAAGPHEGLFDAIRWMQKWHQTRLNLTGDTFAATQVKLLQRIGQFEVAKVTLGAKKGVGRK